MTREDFEKTMALAEKLDECRLVANEVPALEAQTGVYGVVSEALVQTLRVLNDGNAAAARMAYQALLDGASVKEAMDYARSN